MRQLLLSFFLIIQLQNTLAKDPEPDMVLLKKYVDLDIQLVHGKLKISEHHQIEQQFYKNFSKYSKESIFYSDFDRVTDFEAMTFIPHKSRYKKIEVEKSEVRDIVQPGIFYGGYKRLNFVYPSMQYGALGKLTYTKSIKDPHFINPYYFVDQHEVVDARYTVTCPKDVKINFKIFGEDTDQIQFTKTQINNEIKYTWTAKNMEAYQHEDSAPGKPYTAPHIIILIDSYEYRSNTLKVLSNVEDLYGWYRGLINQINDPNSKKVKEKLEEIITNKDVHQDTAQAIFQWVQKNIKYVAFEDGMAGFVPRVASDVLSKRYGDCKDMANLLKEMLSVANIDSYLAWIGTRRKPYSYHDLPCTLTDNHMICAIKQNGNYLFLDATNPYIKFGQPTSMIQGKEALIGINNDTYKIVKVPTVNATTNVRSDSINLKIFDGNVHGTFLSTLTGYEKSNFEYERLKAKVTNDTEYLRDHFLIGNNNIKISNESFEGIGDGSPEGKIAFKFQLPGYARQIGDKVYLNLNLHNKLPGKQIDISKRESEIEEEYKYVYRSVISFRIPENYSISYLPTDQQHDWPHATISSTYHAEGNVIYYQKEFISNFLYLDKSEFQNWNHSLEAISNINQESIILKQQ